MKSLGLEFMTFQTPDTIGILLAKNDFYIC